MRTRKYVPDLGIFLASRVFVALCVLIAARQRSIPLVCSNTQSLCVGRSWDSGFYLTLAHHGYPITDAFRSLDMFGFFPLFPAVVWLVSLIGISAQIAALVVGLLSGVVTTILLGQLCDAYGLTNKRQLILALFWFSPASMVLSTAYAEVVLVPLVLGFLLAIRKEHFACAGLLAAVAIVAKPQAALLLPIGVIAAIELRTLGRKVWQVPALATLGVAAMALLGQILVGNANIWTKSQKEVWHQHIGLAILPRSAAYMQTLAVLVGLSLFAAGIILAIRSKFPLYFRSLVWVVALGVMSVSGQYPRARYVLLAVPIYFLIAERLSPRTLALLVPVFSLILGWISVASLVSLFVTP